MDYFQSHMIPFLPSEIVTRILAYSEKETLFTTALVNKVWSHLSVSFLWRSLTLFPSHHFFRSNVDQILDSLSQFPTISSSPFHAYHVYVQTLKLDFKLSPTFTSLQKDRLQSILFSIIKGCLSLKHLQIHKGTFPDTLCRALPFFYDLETFEWGNTPLNGKKIIPSSSVNDSVLISLISSCPRLKGIHIG